MSRDERRVAPIFGKTETKIAGRPKLSPAGVLIFEKKRRGEAD
jgi:hypothetical protein